MNEILRGDIYYVKNNIVTEGSEMRGGRPAIIVSNLMNNHFSSTVEVVYLTSKRKNHLPTHVPIQSTGRDSLALCEQISTISKRRLSDYVGK